MQETVQTESVHTIRKQCLTDVNAIQNALYCIDKIETLKEVNQMLLTTKSFLSERIPSVGSLPVRLSRYKKNRKRRQKQSTKKSNTSVHTVKCIPMDSTLNENYETDCQSGMYQ